MKPLRRITALLLCVMMLVPSQGITTQAEIETIIESNTLEAIETEQLEDAVELDGMTESEETQDRVEETLPLQPVIKAENEDEWNGDAIIYWNPGGELQQEAASPSDATPSDARKGNDRANGLSPKTPVKSLEAALKRAQKLQDEEGVSPSEITIYAMSPMEIADGEFYLLNGSDVEIASWPERAYDSDVIFYLNGGQLALTNIRLESRDIQEGKQDAELVKIHGGALQMGQGVEIAGSVTMDYRAEKEDTLWDKASNSDTSASEASQSDAAAFDISEYLLSEKSAPMELQRKSVSARTWREPIIELLDGFEGEEGKYRLEVLGDSSTTEVDLVKTLYADGESEEDFKKFFSLVGGEEEAWELVAASQATTRIRDTGVSDLAEFRSIKPIKDETERGTAGELTVKTLIASRAGNLIYWNPGPAIVVNGKSYGAGNDKINSGFEPAAALKTLEKAISTANGGTVICMQSVDLAQNPEAYLGAAQPDGSYLVKSGASETIVTLNAWEPQPQPAFMVPVGKTLVLQDIVLAGVSKERRTPMVLVNGGDVVIEKQVTAETGYLEMNASETLKNHPLTVNSDQGGEVMLFVAGINEDLSYRYTDVVVPGGELAVHAETDPDAAGQVLSKRVKLDVSNRDEAHGGKSKFDWRLRQDTAEDDSVATVQNLELYADYYYDAIYLNGVSGDDVGFGATCQYPVKTWTKAKAIWEEGMEKSIAARMQAAKDGKDAVYINSRYPLPSTIYLCDTVTVGDTQSWELNTMTDYDGSRITTEIVSHTHPADRGAGMGKVHEVPKTLIQVTTGGNLTLTGIPVRNITDDADSVTVLVDVNAEFTLNGTSLMTGERKHDGADSYKAVTRGTHIRGMAGSQIKLPSTWTGVIEKRQHGVEADGVGTMLTMSGGTIQKNNSYDTTRDKDSTYVPIKGAGVVLSGGAAFVMEGGTISENEVYQYGAGVYMEGTGTTFDMKAGEISANKMTRYHVNNDSATSPVTGYGMGVYGGKDTKLTIGESGGADPFAAQIVRNRGYLIWGAGVYSDGVVTLNQGRISENIGNPTQESNHQDNICRGLGIYISSAGLFQMEDGEISNNKTEVPTDRYYESCFGAGLYLGASQQDNYIHGGVISNNRIGRGHQNNASVGGGGIYLEGKLEVENAEIKNNKARYGAGIYVKGTSSSSSALLTIENTLISENSASNTYNTSSSLAFDGFGGGIYSYRFVNITLKEGTEISKNQASDGGGIYLNGDSSNIPSITDTLTKFRLQGTAGDPVKINDNKSHTYGNGGGVYVTGSTLITGSHAEIIGNQAVSGVGGGMCLQKSVISVLSDITISKNKAKDGGGIYSDSYSSKHYLSDMTITQNQASGNGGGIYTSGVELFLTETIPNKFLFSGNTAEQGGGIYSGTNGKVVWDLSGSMQNSATKQGANLYLSGSMLIQLLDGHFQQPQEPVSGVYNVYASNTSTGIDVFSLDMTKINIEKKNGQFPDAVYLNTANSYLTYLQTPVSQEQEALPIDLNTDAFKVGSVVIKPGNVSEVIVWEPTEDCTSIVSRQIDIAKTTDATAQLGYSSGGMLPRRTQLGGFHDSQGTSLTNAVLVGEGIYLKSAGNDANSGLSPDQAVATFETAKERLKEQIEWHDVHGTEGFSPFIYICGNVLVNGDVTWSLDYDDTLFTTTNVDYKTAEEAVGETVYPAQVCRFASFVTAPMIEVGTSTMPAAFQTDKIIINGLSDAVITSSQGERSPIIQIMGNSAATLTGYSQLTNNYSNGVLIKDGGKLVLTGTVNEPNEQIVDINGAAVSITGAGAEVEMNDYARIISKKSSQNFPQGRSAINSTAGDTHILIKDHSRIEDKSDTSNQKFFYGIYSSSKGKRANIELQDEAFIGGSLYGIMSSGTDSRIVMQNSAGIGPSACGISLSEGVLSMEDTSWIKDADTGVRLENGAQIYMNRNLNAAEDDLAWIGGGKYGIEITAYTAAGVFMGKGAELRNNTTAGIFFNIFQGGNQPILIEMSDKSKIMKSQYGIYSNNRITVLPVRITMKDEAAIEACTSNGIFEYGESNLYGFRQFSLTMEDDSRISGNGGYGILLQGGDPSAAHQITMRDRAVIGGQSGNYDVNLPDSGNKYAGIRANSPLVLDMSGTSQIAWNGGASYTDAPKGSGIYLERNSSFYAYRSGTGSIVLRDQASVCSNGRGIYLADLADGRQNPFRITMDGTDGGTPSIQANKYGTRVNKESTLKMKGSAFLGRPTAAEEKYALDCYGKMELDGRSAIEGEIYLRVSANPITMTHKVEDPLRRYYLYLAESFLGKVVVQPDDPGSLNGGIQDVTDQFSYFDKKGGEGLAQVKALIKSTPNIILGGDNNVYLSGAGDDANDGGSPDTAVRTFKKAKELLQNKHFTSGANILICKQEVQVLAGDEDWSFETGGLLTNKKSGDTWMPKVIRDKSYTMGNMIQVSYDSATLAKTVTFEHITIDGGSEEGIVLGAANASMMQVIGNATAVLGEGAIVQNQMGHSGDFDGLYLQPAITVKGGTLEIDGGIIRGMTRTLTKYLDNNVHSSAVLCQTEGSKVIMRSGQIMDNSIHSNSGRGGAVVVINGGEFEMSGGIISGNVMTGNTKGAALYVEGAKATIQGGVIRGNKGLVGSAIYYVDAGNIDANRVTLSGGQISGNTTGQNGTPPAGANSPIYVGGSNFQLKGGGALIQDNLYLDSTKNIIKVSGNIYQAGRLYNIHINQGSGSNQFKKGSVVVRPDGNWVTDVTPFLQYFRVKSNPYVLDRGQASRDLDMGNGIQERQTLLLMQAVYLDSVAGVDSNGGMLPVDAVKSFGAAKLRGEAGDGKEAVKDYYIIYISGKAANTAGETQWTLSQPAYMCRYTGFPIYNSDGSETPEVERYYYGTLIEPLSDLTLTDIRVYGRRSNDTTAANGESLVRIKDGITVTVPTGDGSIFGRNLNMGPSVDYENGLPATLSSKGGAFYVDPGGCLNLSGGTILETEAAYGSAIYQDADAVNPAKFGRLYLSGSPSVSGKTYLAGRSGGAGAYVEPDAAYQPASPLEISIEDDYTGRSLVRYRDGIVPGADQYQYYIFDDAIQAIYDIINRDQEPAMLELWLRRAIYLDGVNGNDETGDGLTPETAYRTLRKTYDTIGNVSGQKGVLVFIVDTVTLENGPSSIQLNNILVKNQNGERYYEGAYTDENGKIEILGQVYFKRYVQPAEYKAGNREYTGYGKPTNVKSLFQVTSGKTLTLSGIYVDGHSRDSEGSVPVLQAKGVEADAPLITVESEGELICSLSDKTNINNGIDTVTLLTNNTNKKVKDNVIGQLNGSDIKEGSGAGIEILDGKVTLVMTVFENLKLGEDVVAGGTDIYQNGELHFSSATQFSGSVYLEGQGTLGDEPSHTSSRYLQVDLYGLPAKTDFQVLMRDPYTGRTVVDYVQKGDGPGISETATYRLEDRVKKFFYLSAREGAPYIFELQLPSGIYIDGTHGLDDLQNPKAGSTPSTPVKTLRRAFELLKTRAGKTIYVVGTIQLEDTIHVTGNSYQDSQVSINLGSTDRVEITRYIQPDYAADDSKATRMDGYDVKDFKGALLNVKNGATATFGRNVFFDGHSEPRFGDHYLKETTVTHKSEAKAPLITVDSGGTLNLLSGTTLLDNNNNYKEKTDGIHGGALHNSGTTTVDGALFTNNKAQEGSGVYQNGTFTITSKPGNLADHAFYLTSKDNVDHVIQTAVMIPDGLKFEVDMENPVKGRDVVRFTDPSAYAPNADAEHEHFQLSADIAEELFLVQAKTDETVLELQNWEILDVEVPQNIYLVMQRKAANNATITLKDIRTNAAGNDLLTSPEYTITNRGIHGVKVSISEFANKNTEAGISSDHPIMTLTNTPQEAIGETELYLAVKGLDSGTGFTMAETSLKPFAESTVTASPVLMGSLDAGDAGHFTFKGTAGGYFIDKYKDSTFPIEGATREEVQAYMDGTPSTSMVNARAKYDLKYKLEIDPPRRAGNETP